MEYIKFENSEKIYAQKQALYAEMELLKVKKNIGKYSALRKKETVLRNSIKKYILELKTEIKNFEKLVPSSKFKSSSDVKEKIIDSTPKKRSQLEGEIEEIKLKIQRLSMQQ